MFERLLQCVSLLNENDENIYRDVRKTLLKICEDILQHPLDKKYRQIQFSDSIITYNLIPAFGAIECLFEAGFVEKDDGFLLPLDASLNGIQELLRLLNNRVLYVDNGKSKLIKCDHHQKGKKNYRNGKYIFFFKIHRNFERVLRYEDEKLLEKAKAIIPIDQFETTVASKIRILQREIKVNQKKCGAPFSENDIVLEDLILAELLRWFTNDFFEWVNSPVCPTCNIECLFESNEASLNPEISTIEIHKCKICGKRIQFPRYIDPELLMITRKGRCEEWANVFTLFCRGAGFDARFIVDETDHVWTEIWSVAHNRWIHVDPCENAIDHPLMYEKGWKKKLSYVIAFSKDEIQDVTWKYTSDQPAVMQRRQYCTELSLVLLINQMNNKRQSSPSYSEVRKRFVVKRFILELVDMLCAPPGCNKPGNLNDEDEYVGRSSGSLEWRLARQELQGDHSSYQWTIEKHMESIEIRYSVVTNTYEIEETVNGRTTLKSKIGWQSGVEDTIGGIFRKEEKDWQILYLARSAGSDTGRVKWTFIINEDANLCVDVVELQTNIAIYYDALIRWEVEGWFTLTDYGHSEEKKKTIFISNYTNFKTQELRGSSKVTFSVTLTGGKGDQAWQHAQLFRHSSVRNIKEHSLMIKISTIPYRPTENKLHT